MLTHGKLRATTLRKVPAQPFAIGGGAIDEACGVRSFDGVPMFDINALLLGTAMSGLCLSATMFAFWTANRGGGFMVTWSAGVVVIVCHLVAFWFYANGHGLFYGVLACTLLPTGVAGVLAAARQFSDMRPPMPTVLWTAVPYILVAPPMFALGYDGIALVIQNAVVAVLFALCGLIYWRRRAEAPVSLAALSALYGILAVSFTLCGAVLVAEAQLHIGSAPSNWAEDINVVASVVCMTGIGALTLSLDQSRMAVRHEAEARTDALTGLLNRRALLEANMTPFGPRKAIVVFDLDHFKLVNDRHGHAVGDIVLRRFGEIARNQSRRSDQVARLGGEEFALVMSEVTPELARKVAEGIAARFAEAEIVTDKGVVLRNTVSAGIAFGDSGGPDLADVLSRADRALYEAKRGGRNRVETGEWRLVS